MNRNFASALTFATTVAAATVAAAIVSSNAFADDITIDNTPFVSTRSRAEVQAEFMRQPELVRTGATEWSMQYNQAPQVKSAYTRAEATSQYKASRQEVSALTGEDSGSSYFSRRPIRVNVSTAMGGPAR